MIETLQGKFLVASPYLPDPNFFRSVVLLVQHGEEGALGLILNRPSDNTVQDVWEAVSDLPCDSQEPLFMGGPVEGPIMALHSVAECSEDQVTEGIYLAANKENLDKIVSQDERPYRLFSGYAGWGATQLEEEMEMGGWLLCDAGFEQVFLLPVDALWEHITRSIGDDILRSSLNIHDWPDDPSVN